MATNFTLHHMYAIEPEAFWRDVFFDHEYNRSLYIDGLGFQAYDILEETNPPDGRRTRKVKASPRLDAPGPIKAALGDKLSYIEEGRLEPLGPNGPRWISRVIPSTLTKETRIEAEMWLVGSGPGKSERHARFDIEVKKFGLQTIMESFLKKSMEESYGKAAEYTNIWLKKTGRSA